MATFSSTVVVEASRRLFIAEFLDASDSFLEMLTPGSLPIFDLINVFFKANHSSSSSTFGMSISCQDSL